VDIPLILTVIALAVFGLIMLYSASFDFSFNEYGSSTYMFVRQVKWLGLGIAVAFVLSLFDYHNWRKIVLFAMLGTIVLLITVLIINEIRLGASRSLFEGSYQPSEISERGSIIVVVATDAPVLSQQLKRLARRVSLGLGRNGSISGDGSGDIFIAFSTANPHADGGKSVVDLKFLPNDALDPIFAATVQAVEESIINAMIAAPTMTGIENHKVTGLPHDKLRDVLKKYNRLVQ